jgi:hypothetical protein
MKRITPRILSVSAIAGLLAAVAAPGELVRNPTQVGTSIDFGQIVKGQIWDGQTPPSAGNEVTRNQTITRTGVYLTESGVYNERLTIQLTIGGLFWFALPETRDFQDRRVQFGPGVGQAQAVYAFGADPSAPAATLQFGLFPHKYSESVNLGEYLYRSGTYPAALVSGGWSYLNAAAYMAQGINVTVPMLNGMLKHNFTVFIERDLQPTNDLSPGYMLTARPLGFIELGAGVVWAHAISLNSARLDPKGPERDPSGLNAYSKSTGRPINGDTAATPSPCASGVTSDCGYYTFKGFKTSARAALDIGMLLGSDMIKANDFKIYSEVALLGVEDQPYFYEKKIERMPVMFGVNLPTLGILDRLAVEAEYRKSPFPNSNVAVLQYQVPIPVVNAYELDEDGVSLKYDPDDAKYDDWKWTVYARRRVIDGINIYAQAASDHLRHFNRSAAPGAEPATPKASDWYYVFRLEFGI